MSAVRVCDEKTIAPILVCLLSSMVLLAATSSPPLVRVSDVSELENGAIVRVLGVLVDFKVYDSGSEGLVLADLHNGAVLKIISSPGVRDQPSSYAKIGDELLVKAEVGFSGSSNILFTSSDDVIVSRASDLVLTVASVSRNWFLFDGDVVRVKGLLERTESGTGLRLSDLSSRCSIAVLPSNIDLAPSISSVVTLTAEVKFDLRSSSLTLVPVYVAANP